MSSSDPTSPPAISSAQVREVDRLATDRFRIPVDWLMEAAGWQVARHCRDRTAVLCGRGNNGGDGLAAARHLHRWGRLASVACLDRARLEGPALMEAEALEAAGVAIGAKPDLGGARSVVDALFGTGLNRPPDGRAATWIERVNRSGMRVVAVDVPSGVDADSGQVFEPAMRANVTVCLGLAKAGLLQGPGRGLAGEVWIADIGVPPEAYREVGLEVPLHLFSMHDRVQLASLRL